MPATTPKTRKQRKNGSQTARRTQNALNNDTFFRIVGHVERLYYSTGQVASQLGVTLATVRTLCEKGVIKAETTPGGQWRVPESEVERLNRDGLPPIPRPLPIEAVPEDTSASLAPSDAVATAQDQVAIARSTLEKRKIDREAEENEDWFRNRKRERETAAALERQKANAQLAAQRRQQWIQEWIKYALGSVPRDAWDDFAIEVHAAVSTVLSKLLSTESGTTKRLVDAAVHRAIHPWQRKQDVQRALTSAMDLLPWDVQTKSSWAHVKEYARKAAAESVEKLPKEAKYREMAAAAEEAVQPWIAGFKHVQACLRTADSVYIYDATTAEREAAIKAVFETLTKLPVGTTGYELENAKDVVLAPYKTAIARRKETARLESEKQARRLAAERRVDSQLGHIEQYLRQEYTFDGGEGDLREEVDRLRPVIRAKLTDRVLKAPQNDAQIRAEIERLVDDD